ncbi:MAG TPA: hypothetical protein PK674_02765 [Candidatus Absconditabacterales bacterium]|nr:hypothetical protein [Candidatus Absconditabacterales bacterium]HOQ79159.1 hypothetical protein [Candidatus Absconditabacterales bacterium]HPK28228.1 hypothetical protein [Candidatus Absconditabacterales bacterium]
MRKEKYIKIIGKHGNTIKIISTLLTILAMIVAARTYITYNSIIEAINNVNHNIRAVEDEIAYSNNFLKYYLDSEYSDYFLAHKNNILFNGEFIIKFQAPLENEKEEKNIENKNIIQTPQESRQHFIKSKIHKK